MFTVAVPLPPALVAVTVYDVDASTAVGVPEIDPFEVEKERPAALGVAVVIAVPLVSVNELGV